MLEQTKKLRYNIIIVITYIVGIILLFQLFNLQVIKGSEYRETSNTRLTRESTVKAARGNITDNSGNKLVTTKTGFSLELYKTKIDNDVFNNLIYNLAVLLEKNKDKYNDNLPITVNPYAFTSKDEEIQKKWKKEYGIDENATAEEAFNFFKKKYDVKQDEPEKARKIMTIRYEISRNGYSNIKPVIISNNISYISANQIKEQSNKFPGTAVVTVPIVTYPYGSLASHILGYVGSISAEEYDANKDKYGMNDTIGKTGMQYTLEEYLKGQDGVRQVDMSVDGTITEEYISQEAVAGNNVALTIDSNLQKVTEKALAENIKKISNGAYGKKYNAKNGAAIVMNIKTGEVLALASYPDYEPELFVSGISQSKLDEYNKNKNCYNWAISGTYAPGSVFKMVVATAALEEKIITTQTTINDTGIYPRGHKPACWIYTDRHYGHGYLNVTGAIKKSCNYFFYELGYRMGIDPVIKYAKAYGLGIKTGIELSGEAEGIVDLKKQCQDLYGQQWQLGDTLSAVIGQSYNDYTPIQIARYVSMLANGGKSVDVTLIKSITDADGNKISKDEYEKKIKEKLGIEDIPEVKDLNIKKENLDAILKGMKGVTSETGGTAYYVFSDLDIDIGGKTGSAETGIKNQVNGWFAGFAPYDDPEIAIVVFIENAGSGGNVGDTAKTIINEYLGMNAKDVKEDLNAIPSTQINN